MRACLALWACVVVLVAAYLPKPLGRGSLCFSLRFQIQGPFITPSSSFSGTKRQVGGVGISATALCALNIIGPLEIR